MRRSLILSLALASALVLSVAPFAGASTAPVDVTRAQFVLDFDKALGLQPVYPATPDFTDVPSSNPYYGYIEAAIQKGYIAGVGAGLFDPNGLLTRAQIAKIEVLALGEGPAAALLMGAPSGFKDDSQIPSWARGYILEAIQLGLVHGYPNGTFSPNANLTTSDEGFFLAQYQGVSGASAGSAVSVTATPQDVSVGQQVILLTTVKNGAGQPLTNFTTTYSVDSTSAIISGSTFVASQSGTYTVTAQTSSGVSGTTTVSVYGSPVAIRLVPQGTPVADGSGTTTVNAEVVDQNNNVVQNATGNIALFYLASGGATSILEGGIASIPNNLPAAITDGTTGTVTDGMVSFTLRAGTVPGAQDTLEAEEYTGAGTPLMSPTDAQTTITTLAPVATSVSLTAPKALPNNQTTAVNVTAQVLDQNGVPILSGAYALNVSLQGQATLGNGQTQGVFSYIGSGQPQNPATTTIPVEAVQGASGTVTLTVTVSGLPAATTTFSDVAVGTAASFAVTAPATDTFSEAQGTTGITFSLEATDAHGYPVPYTQPVNIEVEKNGTVANNIRIDGYSQGATGAVDAVAAGKGSFTITDSQIGANAGTYTVLVGDPNKVLIPAPAATFAETAGPAAVLHLTDSATVSLLDPKTTVTASLQDLYGNTVTSSGIPVTFTSQVGNPSPGVTFSAATVDTVNGVASTVATVPPYVGDVYWVDAAATGTSGAKVFFSVANTVAANFQISVVDLAQGGDSTGQYVHSTTSAQASDTVQITISAVDPYGQTVKETDGIQLNFSSAGLVPTYSSSGFLQSDGTNEWKDTLTALGTDVITCTAEMAGQVTLTVSDTSVATVSSSSALMSIIPGKVWSYQVFDTSGNNVSQNGVTVTGNSPTAFQVSPVDQYSNKTTATVTTTLSLTDGAAGGQFRLSPGGTTITSVQILPGESQVTVYYTNAVTKLVHLFAN